MKAPKYIIFDCDGVLIDSEILANRVEAELKNELGFPITLEQQIKKFVGMGMNHPDMQAELKRLPTNYLDLVDQKMKQVYQNELQPIAGTIKALETLAIPKCVASSSEPEWLETKLSITNLKKYFGDSVFHGKLVSKCKPEPDLFLFALKQLGWSADDCLVVEDSVYGVQAGRAAGLHVCGFLGGTHVLPGHSDRLIQAGANYLVSDLKDLRL